MSEAIDRFMFEHDNRTSHISESLRPVIRSILTPARLERLEKYLADRQAIEDDFGLEIASVWETAQYFIGLPRRVKPPPTGWGFAAQVQSLSHGVKPEFEPIELSEWRAFWNWYVPLEYNLMQLIRTIRRLHSLRPDHDALLNQLCGIAIPILDQYQRWVQDRKIAWLPKDRVPHSNRTIIERLGQVLIDCDSGPAPELEPFP